jgi:hypothetical protein
MLRVDWPGDPQVAEVLSSVQHVKLTKHAANNLAGQAPGPAGRATVMQILGGSIREGKNHRVGPLHGCTGSM